MHLLRLTGRRFNRRKLVVRPGGKKIDDYNGTRRNNPRVYAASTPIYNLSTPNWLPPLFYKYICDVSDVQRYSTLSKLNILGFKFGIV